MEGMSPERPALRTVLVGAGAIARSHARAIRATPGLELAAIVSRGGTGARALADELDAAGHGPRPRAEAGLAEALAHGSGEAADGARPLVVVATPTSSHLAVASDAIAAGAHVLIEKPLDVDLEAARRFALSARRAEDGGAVVSVVSQHRFDAASLAVRDAVRAGRLGMLTAAAATVPWWRSAAYFAASPWRGTFAGDGGGALMNQGIHTLDLLVALLGRPVEVAAMTARTLHAVEAEDVAGLLLRFESGALATMHASTSAYPGLASRLQVSGSLGSAVIENETLVYLHADPAQGAPDYGLYGAGNQLHAAAAAPRAEPTESPAGLARQYADLVDAVAGRRRPVVTVDDALVTLGVIDAAYRSARLGRTVAL
jgi:predicted dehydrogenase